jgi:hypothetical protein
MDTPKDVSQRTATFRPGGSSSESKTLPPREVDFFSEYANEAIELKVKELRRFLLKYCPPTCMT